MTERARKGERRDGWAERVGMRERDERGHELTVDRNTSRIREIFFTRPVRESRPHDIGRRGETGTEPGKFMCTHATAGDNLLFAGEDPYADSLCAFARTHTRTVFRKKRKKKNKKRLHAREKKREEKEDTKCGEKFTLPSSKKKEKRKMGRKEERKKKEIKREMSVCMSVFYCNRICRIDRQERGEEELH